jgi:hypothetical protein
MKFNAQQRQFYWSVIANTQAVIALRGTFYTETQQAYRILSDKEKHHVPCSSLIAGRQEESAAQPQGEAGNETREKAHFRESES